MNIPCFNIPAGTIPQAAKVYTQAFNWAERYREALTLEVRKQIALGRVTQWACDQDDPANLDRVATIVRQAGELILSRYCFEDRIG